jgi:hypothetical protein
MGKKANFFASPTWLPQHDRATWEKRRIFLLPQHGFPNMIAQHGKKGEFFCFLNMASPT